MKNLHIKSIAPLFLALLLVLTACGQESGTSEEPMESTAESTQDTSESEEATEGTVTINDLHGSQEVPVNPERVASLDNRTFETLEAWGVELVAAPKAVMTSESAYVADENVVDIGNHREPNFELLVAADPEVVIIGQRFASFYEDIKELLPEAIILDFNFDVSETAEETGVSLVNGLTNSTLELGELFDKNDEAQALVDELNASIDQVKEAYNGEDAVMATVVSGGQIGYSAPSHGRVWGPLFEIFDWTPSLDVNASSSNHQGDDISLEAIAESNPDWLLVLDRDGATTSNEESLPAQDVIENSATLQNATALTEGQVVYAPTDTYVNESIQTFIDLFKTLANAFSGQ